MSPWFPDASTEVSTLFLNTLSWIVEAKIWLDSEFQLIGFKVLNMDKLEDF